MNYESDALIIGGGVVGCSVAHELSKYEIKVSLLEKKSDVCGGASKANSGVVHSGIYSLPGSYKAKLCVKGNELFTTFCQGLGVEFQRTGKLVIARNEKEIEELEKLKEAGEKNGVRGIKFVDKNELEHLEPNIEAIKALIVPSAGIVSPYKLTIALAENAWENNVKIYLNSEVLQITKRKDSFGVKTANNTFYAKWVVNCAGLYCDKIADMAGIKKYKVYPCRGEYLILDKNFKHLINHLIYPPPENGSGGLGIHLTPTLEGNILIGPSAEYIEDREDTRTTKTGMDRLLSDAASTLKNLPEGAHIQSYAGIRCKLVPEDSNIPGDFIIEEDEKVKGFINLMGIESPGLSAAPAIAKMIVDIIQKTETLGLKKDFKVRRVIKRFDKMDWEEKAKLIKKNPKQGHVICRCENVTEQEIVDALDNPLKVRTLARIKYGSRATMGRCQGGFCKPRIIKIMDDLFQPDIKDITQKGEGSNLFVGKTKDLRRHDKKRD